MNKSFQYNGTSYVSSLPFINTQTGNWFDVTPTGDSKIDYTIGVNCAILLLKAMGQDNENFDYSPFKEGAKVIMPNVVKSMVKQGESLQEITSGFFFMIDVLLQSFSPKLIPEMANKTYDSLIAEIHPALSV